MKEIYGDLIQLGIDGEFDVIIHGCNCFCTMGGGIARSIKKRFPTAYAADCETEKGSRKKLGTYTFAKIPVQDRELIVVNAYTQYGHGKGKVNVDYDAMRDVMRRIKQDFLGKRLGYPLIGAGLAGGDWNIISQIIEEELKGEDHTLVRYQP